MKKLFLFFLTILITITFLFTWNSCTDSVVDSTITEGSSDIISLEKNGKEKPDPDDKALPCDNRVEVAYEFHHYETVTGKIFGIWPHPLREDDTTQLRELRTKWGFNYILHQYDDGSTDYQKKIDAGYDISEMMVTINDFNNYNHQWVVDDFEGAYAFYSDEPHQNYYSFYGMRSYINSNSPGSFFITGDYKPTTGFQSYVDEVDKVMFTAYFRWYEILPDVWTDYYHANPDQRWNWEYYKNKYGSKSKSNWIAAHRDAAEFSDLLGKAQNLGLNEIWFYQNQNNMESVIQQYCLNAWVKGFLKRYVQKVTRYYTCIEHDCEICSEGGTWILYNTIYGNIQEDIY